MAAPSSAPRKKWKIVEDVVGMIEKSVVPGARVKVNVNLPVLGKKRKRQCDVAIWYDIPSREFLTIVEVQKRNRKPTETEFDGWLTKRKQVGANCLIAVSAKGFPSSVIERAKEEGNCVRLLTLTDLSDQSWPVNIVGRKASVTIKSHKPKLEPILVTVDGPSRNVEFKLREKVFKRTGRLLSLVDLAEEAFDAIPQLSFLAAGTHVIPIRIEPGTSAPMTLLLDGAEVRVRRVELVDQITIRRCELPLTLSEYVPVEHRGAQAYALVGTGIVDDRSAEMRLIFLPQGDGLLRLADVSFDGLPEGKREVRLIPASFAPGGTPTAQDRVLTRTVE